MTDASTLGSADSERQYCPTEKAYYLSSRVLPSARRPSRLGEDAKPPRGEVRGGSSLRAERPAESVFGRAARRLKELATVMEEWSEGEEKETATIISEP